MDEAESGAAIPMTRRRPLALLHTSGVLSIAAGAVHAAAIGAHAEHPRVVTTFAILAVLQIGAGAFALSATTARRQNGGAIASLVVNLAAAVGWVLAKTTGIGFIDGLGEVEPIQFADGLAAAMAFLAVDTAALHLAFAHRTTPTRTSGDAASAEPTTTPGPVPTTPAVVAPMRGTLLAAGAVAVLTVFGMTAASTHHHEGSDGHSHATGEHGHHDSEVATTPYDPTKPIDLGGVEGVTPEQQARAENLVAVTLAKLPQFADWTTLEARGFHSIQDGFTGYEHFINWDYMDDEFELDPDRPESVVFETQPDGTKKLASAMFFAKPGTTLETVPDIGGALTQWHIHDNLCYVGDPPVVAGLTNFDGTCTPPARTLGDPRPMIHVWIVKHRCGPFSALDGIGAGQVKEGETQLCDSAHGSHHG